MLAVALVSPPKQLQRAESFAVKLTLGWSARNVADWLAVTDEPVSNSTWALSPFTWMFAWEADAPPAADAFEFAWATPCIPSTTASTTTFPPARLAPTWMSTSVWAGAPMFSREASSASLMKPPARLSPLTLPTTVLVVYVMFVVGLTSVPEPSPRLRDAASD